MTIPELVEYQKSLVDRGAELHCDIQDYGAELARRFGDMARAGLVKAGKSHGILTEVIESHPGFRLRHKTDRRVSWNQDMLRMWARESSIETVMQNCSVTIAPRESWFSALPDDDAAKEMLAQARTERYLPTSFEILPPASREDDK
jgi:hypothetical protein